MESKREREETEAALKSRRESMACLCIESAIALAVAALPPLKTREKQAK